MGIRTGINSRLVEFYCCQKSWVLTPQNNNNKVCLNFFHSNQTLQTFLLCFFLAQKLAIFCMIPEISRQNKHIVYVYNNNNNNSPLFILLGKFAV